MNICASESNGHHHHIYHNDAAWYATMHAADLHLCEC